MTVVSGMPVQSNELLGLDHIRAARACIASGVLQTPLLAASSDPAWAHLWLKAENLQSGGAFKLRGALNFVRRMKPEDRARGVITYSSGNHGQALAIAASRLNIPAVVVMPTTAPRVKVDNVRRFGADVVFAGTTSLHRKERAEALAAERALTVVPPFDHADIIAGQGTVGLEILEQRSDVTTVYVPAGGGGLIAGVSVAVKRSRPGIRVIGVEPEGAPKMSRSLAAGAPVTLDHVDSIADGLLAVRPGALTFAHLQAFVDDVVTVSDDEIRQAMGWLAAHAKLVAEPSGAASVAGAMRLAPSGTAGVHVAVVSGGNLEPSLLASVLSSSGSG